jgi:hypothetical protein
MPASSVVSSRRTALWAEVGDRAGRSSDRQQRVSPRRPAATTFRLCSQTASAAVSTRIAEATVAQHVVTLRQFYEYLIRARLRSDPINPATRGGSWRTGDTAQHGFVRRRGRLPWLAPAEVWEGIVLYVITHETGDGANSSDGPVAGGCSRCVGYIRSPRCSRTRRT